MSSPLGCRSFDYPRATAGMGGSCRIRPIRDGSPQSRRRRRRRRRRDPTTRTRPAPTMAVASRAKRGVSSPVLGRVPVGAEATTGTMALLAVVTLAGSRVVSAARVAPLEMLVPLAPATETSTVKVGAHQGRRPVDGQDWSGDLASKGPPTSDPRPDQRGEVLGHVQADGRAVQHRILDDGCHQPGRAPAAHLITANHRPSARSRCSASCPRIGCGNVTWRAGTRPRLRAVRRTVGSWLQASTKRGADRLGRTPAPRPATVRALSTCRG